MQTRLINLIGWFGVITIVGAYLLVNLGILSVTSLWYIFLNIAGSLALIVEARAKKDYQPVVLNIFWCVIAFIGLLRIFHVF